MTVPFYIVAAFLLFLGITTLFRTDHIFIWKLSIAATEYGHWLALFTLGVISFQFIRGPQPLLLVFLVLSLILFSRPVVQAEIKSREWSSALEKFTGQPLSQPLLSWKRLWFSSKKQQAPEHVLINQLPGDFYRASSSKPTPWVVVVHGGGWDSGDISQLTDLNSHLASRGISVCAVSYRLAPGAKWPAQKEDVLEAARYLKAHATQFNIDPSRWALLGRSAGGQIAEGVAYQENDPTLKGIVAYYSPADLDFAYRYTKDQDIIDSRNLLINYLGNSPDRDPKIYRDASPIQFVHADAPPSLLIHGTSDSLTWHVQSRRLYDRIVQVQGRAVLIELPWATHAFDFNLNGPGGQVATSAVGIFLASVFG